MAAWKCILRGTAEQTVYVEADSASEARGKAREADFFDAEAIDWVQHDEGYWEHGVARDTKAVRMGDEPWPPDWGRT